MPVRGDDIFFDTNVLVYAVSDNDWKFARAQSIIADGGIVSVQVLNEFSNILLLKRRLEWPRIKELLQLVRDLCVVVPLNLATHERGLAIAERYRFHIYDSMILAAALEAGCDTLYSEDMHDGFVIDGLSVVNPFTPPR